MLKLFFLLSFLIIRHAQIKAVEDANLCNGLRLVNTTDRVDLKYRWKSDISVYKSQHTQERSANFTIMELHIEHKLVGQDPFVDPKKRVSTTGYSFEHDTLDGNHSQGQITSYTNSQFLAQPRAFSFSILIIDNYFHLIRWDRAGAVVTVRMDWTKNPGPLATFLFRFNHLADAGRGFDTLISKPTENEIAYAKVALQARALELEIAWGVTDKTPLHQ